MNTEQTTKERTCKECGMVIPADLTDCPHDEGALLIVRAEAEIGATLGNYVITSLVGIGGMSAVYKAKHTVLERVVALKLLHPHLVSHGASLKRFEQEARAISQLSHPNIVGVYEYGVSENQQPYLVMDYLEGRSLALRLHEEGRLIPDDSLAIFAAVADALVHAHNAGILHRDMKPSNIMLVADGDEQEVVKLVDFGLAKLLPSSELETRKLTQTGEIFGSPIYMSPEQCVGKTLDARSDIYSLGCVMYESLCGYPPFVGANVMETMYMRLNEDPKPFPVDLKIPKELEAITLIALAREPELRYRTMAELREDLELVKNAATSGQIRAFKKLRRKRRIPFMKALATVAVLGCVGVTGWLFGNTNHPQVAEHQSAWSLRQQIGQQRFDKKDFSGAEKEYLAAVKEAEKFGDGNVRLVSSLERLAAVYQAEGKPAEHENIEQRIAELKQLKEIGDKEGNLYELAAMTLSMVPEDPSKLDAAKQKALVDKMNHLSQLFLDQGDFDKSQELLSRALAMQKQTRQTDDPQFATTLSILAILGAKLGEYQQAEELLNQAMKIRLKAFGDKHPEIAANLYNLALVHEDNGDLKAAREEYKKALDIYNGVYGTNSPEVAMTLVGYGGLARKLGKFDESESSFRKSAEVYKGLEGNHQISAGMSLNNLADLYYSQGKYAKAAPLYEEALHLLEKSGGEADPSRATIENNLGVVMFKLGDRSKAEACFNRSLSIRERILPPEHPDVAQSLNCVAECYRADRKYDQAEPLYKRALEIDRKALGPDHPEVAVVLNSLGQFNTDRGNFREAESNFRQALTIKEKTYGFEHPQVAQVLDELANLYLKENRISEAETLFQNVLDMRIKTLGSRHPDVAATMDGYAAALYKGNKLSEALSTQGRALAIRLQSFVPSH